jgi:hypothetical protein
MVVLDSSKIKEGLEQTTVPQPAPLATLLILRSRDGMCMVWFGLTSLPKFNPNSKGISSGATEMVAEQPFSSAGTGNTSGTTSSGVTQSDRVVRGDANLAQMRLGCVSTDAARTRKVFARFWRTFRRARLAVTLSRLV